MLLNAELAEENISLTSLVDNLDYTAVKTPF
jgi:hypothetical protein